MTSFANGLKSGLWIPFVLLIPSISLAAEMDMRPGVTEISQRIQQIHHYSLWVCVVVGIIVFGAMFYSMFAHRASRNPTPAQFHESTLVEVVWTAIPVLILVGLAIPATTTMRSIEDNSDSDLTILITGSQWKWHYQYVDTEVGFLSRLTTPKAQIDNLEPKTENYLLEVDNPLVLPTDRKVRFLVASNDVIHSWWVPDIAVKQDAIPGFINEAWADIPVPGIYRGQCAELCGKDHAFMPIVLDVRPADEFDTWLAEQEIAMSLASESAVADRQKTWAMEELMPMGEDVYLTNCSTCHEPDGSGQGSKYPALAGSAIAIGRLEDHLDRVMNGVAQTEMQAWAPQLSDLELAAVLTYERNTWGNDTGDVVQPKTVYESR